MASGIGRRQQGQPALGQNQCLARANTAGHAAGHLQRQPPPTRSPAHKAPSRCLHWLVLLTFSTLTPSPCRRGRAEQERGEGLAADL